MVAFWTVIIFLQNLKLHPLKKGEKRDENEEQNGKPFPGLYDVRPNAADRLRQAE